MFKRIFSTMLSLAASSKIPRHLSNKSFQVETCEQVRTCNPFNKLSKKRSKYLFLHILWAGHNFFWKWQNIRENLMHQFVYYFSSYSYFILYIPFLIPIFLSIIILYSYFIFYNHTLFLYSLSYILILYGLFLSFRIVCTVLSGWNTQVHFIITFNLFL